jgi:hypothetical protein
MLVVRRRLSWLIASWLVCQVAVIAGAPAFDALGIDQDPCCRGVAPGQTCPMHQTRAGDRTCKMRSDCPRPDFALISIISGAGILPGATHLVITFEAGTSIGGNPSLAVNRSDRPDAPPPRA